MLKFAAPLLVFGIVVFVHELGHFIAAKLMRVYAPVFAFGWGPRLFGWKWGETDYRWSWFPIGGFVAMATKDSEAVSAIEGSVDVDGGASGEPAEVPGHQRGFNPIPHDPNALRPFGPHPVPPDRWIESKSLPAKVFILSAGVIMNVVLALAVTTGVYKSMGREYVPAVIDSIVAGRPAEAAGLQRGDSVVSVNGNPIREWDEMVELIGSSADRPLTLEVVRAGQPLTITVVPTLSDATDRVTGAPVKLGRIGAAPQARVLREQLGLLQALDRGWATTWEMGGGVIKVVGGLFSGAVSVKQLGGPIAIARTSFEAAKSGWENLLGLLAFISINLAVLNMLPIPLLDGGQILLRIIESAKGSEFSQRSQEMIMRVGVLCIALLFALVMFNDVSGLIKSLFS